MKITIDDSPVELHSKTPTILKLETFIAGMADGKLITTPQLSAQSNTPFDTAVNLGKRIDPALSLVHKRRLYGNKKTIQAYREQFGV